MPIGGAEDKRASRTILSRFVQLCGGEQASILIIPSASSFPYERASEYDTVFAGLGVANLDCLHFAERRDASKNDNIAMLREATGVFFTGGDQLKLLSLIGGTPFARALRQHFNAGLHVAGTSAGASAMSRQMIAFGRSGATPSQRMVQIASGLGLVDNLIIDQHFQQRNRLGRLTTAVTLNPGMIGVGLDEDTALIISATADWEVVGSGNVTIVDGRGLEFTDVHEVKRHDPITVRGIRVETLAKGMFNSLSETLYG
jgi:cyanophycinase